MITLTGFLSRLPGLRPLLARKAILSGSVLSREEKADIVARDSPMDITLLVGPDAAAAILAAYRQGRLPMERGTEPQDAPGAEAYVSDVEVRRRRDERKRRTDALRDLSLVREADLLDHSFLDALFVAHMGTGSGTMTIAGIPVTKSLSRYPTNSGKGSGWGVTLAWTGTDGQPRVSSTLPPEASNRRNDADQNWGLHD
ncbi:hypothetical protein [Aureimonas sp. AU22]|uniref:hypothetical protein n=1 Tax=Aureimonas sp. AU22 TaxID=1638162 RepID=UPI00078199FB|nr:hypothetical protein [Aureimonas sp. AU22]